MLHVEEENPGGSGHPDERQLNEQVGFPANGLAGNHDNEHKSQIGEDDACPLLAVYLFGRQTITKKESYQRTQPDQHDGAAINPVGEAHAFG